MATHWNRNCLRRPATTSNKVSQCRMSVPKREARPHISMATFGHTSRRIVRDKGGKRKGGEGGMETTLYLGWKECIRPAFLQLSRMRALCFWSWVAASDNMKSRAKKRTAFERRICCETNGYTAFTVAKPEETGLRSATCW